MKKVTVLAMAVLLACMGCATNGKIEIPKSVPPPGCEDSLIYQYIPAPEMTDLAVKIIVFEVAKARPEIREDIMTGLQIMETMLERKEDLTYAGFAISVAGKVAWLRQRAGAELIIVSEALNRFASQRIPITACDRRLLLNHLREQMMYLGMLEGGEK